MKAILNHLFEHKYLEKEKAKEVLMDIGTGKYNQSQITAFIAAFMMRSVNVDELMGFKEALLELCIPVDLSDYDTIDLCGTGGDGKNTFNISTLSSFVVAAAGYKVAKHGNYGVSSVCGSSNVLEKLGYEFTSSEDELKSQIDNNGICFMHAPLFHPAMKYVGPIRRELGMKTFFNMLGPLVNPSKPNHQIVGVFNLELARLYKYLHQSSDKKYAIIHALDGYDEVSLTGNFKLIANDTDTVYSSKDLGLSTYKEEELYGGETIEEAVAIFKKVIAGEGTDAQISAVSANAGLAIWCFDQSRSMVDCVAQAREALVSGKANQVLKSVLNK